MLATWSHSITANSQIDATFNLQKQGSNSHKNTMNEQKLNSEQKMSTHSSAHILPNPLLCAVPPERTMELCKAVMDYLGSKLNGDISPLPSLNSVACLAADIMKELRKT